MKNKKKKQNKRRRKEKKTLKVSTFMGFNNSMVLKFINKYP